MRARAFCAPALALTLMTGVVAAPVAANAQSSHHRQQTKNTWRNIAIGSAALGALGFLKHDNTLGFAGTAGALYSANRYEHDRKSQSAADHQRYNYFHRGSYSYNGHRYHRRTIHRNGQTYYQFVRG